MDCPEADRASLEQLARQLFGKLDPALAGMSAEQLAEFLARAGTPAPRQTGADGKPLLRWQDEVIAREIPPAALVLDLGCGGGELLAELMLRKQVRGQGVELDADAVFQCVARGVPVLQTDLDKGLSGFGAESFDYVILEETLQTLHRPVDVLKEMLRVGRRGIVSFPNFGYWRVRLDLAARGRMPVTEWLPHRWYDTPNIHHLTLQDFLDWTETNGVRLVEGHVLAESQVRRLQPGDNFHCEEALLIVERGPSR